MRIAQYRAYDAHGSRNGDEREMVTRGETDHDGSGLVAVAHPDPLQRLQVPVPQTKAHDTELTDFQPESYKIPVVSQKGQQRRHHMSLLKRLARYVAAIFKLGRTEALAKQARKRINDTESRLDIAEGRLDNLSTLVASLSEDMARAWDTISQLERARDAHSSRFESESQKTAAADAALARTVSDMTRRLDNLLLNQDRLPDPTPAKQFDLPHSPGFDVFKDSFYHRLENRFRGSVGEIANRLRFYLPEVEAAVIRTGHKPAMDIGCGRGEWLGLLKENGIEGFGVDTNPIQIEAAQEQGLDVRQGDALKALAEMEDASLSLITAHHLIEHLPFDAVAWITREAMRVLAPGGILLFETPNTRNVLVGATTFHTDPTHLKPMPEQVLSVLFETAGFDPVDIRHLNPHERMGEFLDKPDFNDELAFLMFGPQDLAVLGTRPQKD
jgi:O-antigen chain-terminating methyltransferase